MLIIMHNAALNIHLLDDRDEPGSHTFTLLPVTLLLKAISTKGILFHGAASTIQIETLVLLPV